MNLFIYFGLKIFLISITDSIVYYFDCQIPNKKIFIRFFQDFYP